MSIAELYRLLCNLVRTGRVTAVNLGTQRCRVTSGGLETDWLPWLTQRAGKSRTWWAPSIGEQVITLAIGGELETAFVLPGLYSTDFPAPSASADACQVTFPDGAALSYEPETGALSVTGVKTAVIQAHEHISAESTRVTVKASEQVFFDTPNVICRHHLSAATFSLSEGGTLTCDIRHSGGQLSSNGIVLDAHRHGGVQTGGSQTEGPQ